MIRHISVNSNLHNVGFVPAGTTCLQVLPGKMKECKLVLAPAVACIFSFYQVIPSAMTKGFEKLSITRHCAIFVIISDAFVKFR